MKRTPGPWEVQDYPEEPGKLGFYRINIRNDDGKWSMSDIARTWKKANAHLIAAAPDLLEAVELAQGHLQHLIENGLLVRDHEETYYINKMLGTTIQKAKKGDI